MIDRLEARLSGITGSAVQETKPTKPAGAAEEAGEAAAMVSEGAPNAWPDESMEATMVAELRERGESSAVAMPVTAPSEAVEEYDTKALPALSELVQRLPPEVRETLDELFRAKFVRVMRVPLKALKS